jgi:hypothetical protein
MAASVDGPRSTLFRPLPFDGGTRVEDLEAAGLSQEMTAAVEYAPTGACVCWGIPFDVTSVAVVCDRPITIALERTHAQWLVFMHTSDQRPLEAGEGGIISPMRGVGQLGELAATYVVLYADGTEERVPIRRRFQLGAFERIWGENCFEAVAHTKPQPVRPHHEQTHTDWGRSQMRSTPADSWPWTNWLYAWENPRPEATIVGVRTEPASGTVVLSGLAAGEGLTAHPLRWARRRKALLTLPDGVAFDPRLDEMGRLRQVQLDMGQVISATLRPLYPNERWEGTYNNQLPAIHDESHSGRVQVLLEYTAHPNACFHLEGGEALGVADVAAVGVEAEGVPIRPVAPATQRVTLRAVERGSRKPVPVKLHVHGEAGEYLAPVDRHRIPNTAWFEDYSVDFSHQNLHHTTYIPGETRIDLPLGRVYIEVSKGFEIRPVRRMVEVTPETDEITVEIERVLPWRERGWVTADTHVHFLSPMSALLEGEAEGVNVVNLLASQWGELMTNVGDFDGRTTWGSREAGGDGEYLVRVGTENRQHVLGHISLLGYGGRIIAPMTTGGSNESALGDPIEILLTEWARQCHKQGGLVILPHFPNPRLEGAAAIVSGEVDGVEMTSWGDLYSGINPYSLSDWYRYLNCGYMVAAVGGTDKMTAATAVGTVRTYAKLDAGQAFDYQAWMDAVRAGRTFATYGPLIEFAVDGHPMGSRIAMSATGGTVDVVWQAASVTVPMSRVELIVNGEIRESVAVDPANASGHWSVRVDKSSWLALLVRGHYPDQPEIVAAHSTPVMVDVEGLPFRAAADAVTILEQIEGAMAYLDTVGTRAETRAYKRMRLVLEAAHRSIHNRMHAQGQYHDHTPTTDHREHH